MFPHGYFTTSYFPDDHFPAWSVLVTPLQVYDLTGTFAVSSAAGGSFRVSLAVEAGYARSYEVLVTAE